MKIIFRTFALLFVCPICLLIGPLSAISEEGMIRAKIGILVQSDKQPMRSAKVKDRLKADDMLRIYVHPETSSFIYVIHTDQKTVALLSKAEHRIHSATMVLPSIQDFYQVDGRSPVETFSIICSRRELKEISDLMTSQMPADRWVSVERDLIQRGTIDLAERPEKPFTIAGTVRGGQETREALLVKDFKIFSGKSVLVKKYEFSVSK